MTRLSTLRSRLTSLRNARAFVRTATAFSALVTAVVLSLAAVFALDLIFELQVPQRIVVFLTAAGIVYWAYHKFTRPFLGVSEDLVQMALLVERRQAIDSDLVAALQFESNEATQWGSSRLQTAVIDHVSTTAGRLDVFDGFDRSQMKQRGLVLAAVIGAAVLAGVLFPEHLSVFANRLLLGSQHYPTRTKIVQILVNHRVTLEDGARAARPVDIRSPQGQPVQFLVKCGGVLPSSGTVELTTAGGSGGRSTVELRAFSLDERLERLQAAAKMLQEATDDPAIDTNGPWRDTFFGLTAFDAQPASADWKDRDTGLKAAAAELAQVMQAWPGEHASYAVLSGELGRLVDNVSYKISAGDAWTDPALISLIPLPVVQPQLTAVPPPYARNVSAATEPGGRQMSALEGTQISMTVESTNKKSLTAVWLSVKAKAGVERFELRSTDKAGLTWELPAAETPFSPLKEELNYELQVTDTDGLHLENPIRGQIRLRADRGPSVTGEMIHKVVLPAAEPVIDYRATDDFGIALLQVKVEVERGTDLQSTAESRSSDDLTPGTKREAETTIVPVLAPGKPATGNALPLVGKFGLKLASLKLPRGPLQKGDRLKLVLEATDDRGDRPGMAAAGEPLILEISDESGVLSAISEADQKSEERLTDIIKRQLGIGEAP